MKQKPVNSTWTDGQWEAIATRNTSILVSAGAGSGKTAVLTERILEILKEGHSILDLIVLTFTNAAAKEMKDRVKKKLLEAIPNGYPELQKELQLLDLASICTFDSFSLNLVKKYHYLLGIENDVKIGDGILIESLKQESLEETFQMFYEQDNAEFLKLLDTFTVKDDTKVRKIVLNLANSLTSRIHIEQELEDCYQNCNREFIQKQLQQYIQEIKNQVTAVVEEITQDLEIAPEPLLPILEQLKTEIEPYQNTYEEIASVFRTIKLPSLPRSKEIDEDVKDKMKEIYQDLKKQIQEITSLCVYPDQESYIEEVLKTKETIGILKEILKVYFKRLLEKKKKYNLYEFHDIGRFAIQLLEEQEKIRKEYQSRIYEIMIDEYQDTNDIGTYFVSMIENNNVYTVGDVKQSIYRFRNANPNIFMNKFYRYQKNEGGKLITLSKNFRSRKEVVDAINFIFQAVMDEKVGGVHYFNQEEMIFGNLSYEKVKDPKTNYEIEVLDYDYKEREEAKRYRKEEIEAFMIAQDIKKRIANHEMIQDKGKLRPVTYSDFAILQDRKTNFDLYKTIFTYLGIPITIHKEESFYATDVIYTIKSILQLVDCIARRKETKEAVLHPFLSLSRSFLGGVSDDSTLRLLNHAKQERRTIFQCMQEESEFILLYEKLNDLAHYSKTHTISSLMREIYHTFQLFDAVIQLGDVEVNSDKLVFLLNLTETLEQNGYDLKQLVTYFEQLDTYPLDVSFDVKKESDVDAVTLMTIHKSKGLEFPICYFSGLTKLFSKADTKERFLYHKDFGLIVPFFEEGIRETFYKTLFTTKNELDDISEKIRVFYVALTRAKEKIILVAPMSDVEEGTPFIQVVPERIRTHYKSLYDIVASIKELLTPYTTRIPLEQLRLTKDYDQSHFEVLDKKVIEPFSDLLSIKEEKEVLTHATYSHKPTEISFEDMDKMEVGTRMHRYLEMMDFHHPEESLSYLDLNVFEKKKMNAFLQADFMRDVQNYQVFHEYEFLRTTEEGEKNGIIDLLLVGEKDAIIVDYKLKEIHKKEYQEQVRGYMEYIEEKLHLPVSGYLYSILDETYLVVE